MATIKPAGKVLMIVLGLGAVYAAKVFWWDSRPQEAKASAEIGRVMLPDAKTGEAVKLVIVKKDASLTEAQVREYCKANMTGYKQPRIIEFRSELPKTPVGKILRRELRNK